MILFMFLLHSRYKNFERQQKISSIVYPCIITAKLFIPLAIKIQNYYKEPGPSIGKVVPKVNCVLLV